MARLSAARQDRITEVLASTNFTRQAFNVKYGDEDNPVVTITYSGRPEYQFVINSNDGVFTTSECPGIHLDAAEIFQRSDFEPCINAIKEWATRVADRQRDWMMDEFGGVADSNPSYKQ